MDLLQSLGSAFRGQGNLRQQKEQIADTEMGLGSPDRLNLTRRVVNKAQIWWQISASTANSLSSCIDTYGRKQGTLTKRVFHPDRGPRVSL